MMRWMVLGASPTAPNYCDLDVDVVIAAGDGITLRHPDYYIVCEPRGMNRYIRRRKDERRLGMKVIVTHHFGGCKFPYDIVVNVVAVYDSSNWHRGQYMAGPSGVLGLQYAVNNGATEVHLVGMEGYTSNADYFTGMSSTPNDIQTIREFPALMQGIVDACPDIDFHIYGNPIYTLKGVAQHGRSRSLAC